MTPATFLRCLVGVAVARTASGRSVLVVVGLVYLSVTVILATLWSAAAEANGGSIVGYPVAAIVWYMVVSEMVTVPVNARVIEDIGNDISSGRLATELLRPRSVLVVRVALEVGAIVPRLGVCAVAGVAFGWWRAGAPPEGLAFILAVPSALLAVVLNVVAMHAFAAMAFWLDDAKTGWFIYQKFVFVLGGMLLPLEVLPEWFEAVAKSLPFMAMAYAPARLASGHVEPGLLAIQVLWLAVAWAATSLLYLRGERRLLAAGR